VPRCAVGATRIELRETPLAAQTCRSMFGSEMHEDLPALATKIGERLSKSSEYLVTQPAELRVLREMSEHEVREFAKSHGWRVIRRLGGRQIEFYNDSGVRAR
jgi:glutamate synthase domain-containing protein 2